MTECIFCLKPILEQEKSVILTQKGVDGILKACDEREDNLSVIVGQSVHTLCRARYINPKTVLLQKKRRNENKDEDGEHSLRSDSSFSYKDNCILCGCPDIYDGKKQDYKLIPVRTMDFGDKLLQACESFPGAWADDVRGRVLFANDLPAADAVYHSACNINFRTGRSIPKKIDVGETYVPWKRKKLSRSGRPKDIERHEAFLMTMEYFQNNDDETVSVQDLMEKMRELLCDTGVEPYGLTHMKNEIQQHFNEKVVITANQGKENIVTLHTTASQIIDKFHQESTKDEDQEKKLIIESAAKLIKQDIKEVKQVKDIYPDLEDLSTETCLQFIPQSLLQFLQSLLSGKKADNKIASIGQALMQAVRPNAITAPLQLGLGVQMHHLFQSKILVDSLNKHGFCSSYSEVKMFERSAAVAQKTDITGEISEGSFLQYSADNIDHNLQSIDGYGTFHGMGIISMITPAVKHSLTIQRVKVTSEDIAKVGRISIKHFHQDKHSLNQLEYENLNNPGVAEPLTMAHLLWESSLILKVPRPQWTGFMQLINQGEHPGATSVMFLPMIAMDPNDLSCIYSTLNFISSHAAKYNVCPVVTFDQPLWLKAFTIVESQPQLQPMVIRLGGFHTMMSYLGCIGHLMRGSGLQELLQVVYAPNSVIHMMSGRAVSRAVRGHLLVDAALNALLTSSALDINLSQVLGSDESTASVPTSTEKGMIYIISKLWFNKVLFLVIYYVYMYKPIDMQ